MKNIGRIIILVLVAASAQGVRADWVKQNSSTFAWLHDVTFVNDSKGWIVGSDGTIFVTIDAGNSWKQFPKFTTDTFREIHFTDENTGWLLCERNIYSRGRSASSYLRKTVDGGRTWEPIEFEDGGRERVTKLVFNKLGWGIAFGEGGKFYKLQEDGRTWKKSQSAIHFLLLGGAFAENPVGAIVGAGGTIMFTEDNGLTWEKASLIGNADARINSVVFVGQKLGWAVGSGGSILASTGGGRLWRTQESGTAADLNDVFFQNARSGWAVGDEGTIVRTQNGGSSWYQVNSRVKHRLERVFFNGSRGWAVGFGGTILSYDSSSTNGPEASPKLRERIKP